MRLVLVFILTVCIAGSSFSQKVDYAKLGIDKSSIRDLKALRVGEKAPDFKFNISGDSVLFSDFVKEHPTVLFFFRGDWCGVCSRHLEKFQEYVYMLDERGIQVLAITPQTKEHIDDLVYHKDLTFQIVSDHKSRIAKAYKVAHKVDKYYEAQIINAKQCNIAESNGDDEAILPLPATYYVNESMTIKFAHFDKNWRKRADVEDIIKGAKL